MSGKAPLPKIKVHISHGVTGGTSDLENILRTGALLPIDERIWHNLKVNSATSPAGDVRSGISEGIFSQIGVSHWGSAKFVFRDDVYLRRDVIVSPTDYGGSPSRYKSYTAYANSLRQAAGDARAGLYEPLSPAARQVHIDKGPSFQGSNEWNPVPGVAMEDVAEIWVPAAVDIAALEAVLQELVQGGYVSAVPQVKSTPTGNNQAEMIKVQA